MIKEIVSSLGDIIYLFIIAAAFIISCLLTPIMRRMAICIGAVDRPDGKRKLQSEPVPYFGGVAIVFGFIIASAAILFMPCGVPKTYPIILIGTVLITLLGVIDDIADMRSYVKFLGQIIIALFTVSCGGAVEYISLFGRYIDLGVLSFPITVIWIVLVINSVNMIDGLDGLACGISSFSLMALLVSALIMGDPISAVLAGAMCGAALGFLPYNITPATIFMGDAGAMALGYVMACISVFGLLKGQAFFSIIVPALILALPVTDAVELFFERISRGRNPFSADRAHIHHCLIDMGLSPRGAVHVLYALSSTFSISAIIYIKYKLFAIILAASTFLIMILIKLLPRSCDVSKIREFLTGLGKKKTHDKEN